MENVCFSELLHLTYNGVKECQVRYVLNLGLISEMLGNSNQLQVQKYIQVSGKGVESLPTDGLGVVIRILVLGRMLIGVTTVMIHRPILVIN